MNLSDHALIRGTIILTITGFITRILGFVYKIYLADLLGARMLGIYQLVFPVYGICYTIYAAGIQTAISQVIAAQAARKQKGEGTGSPGRIMAAGMFLGVGLASLLTLLVYLRADWIARYLLMEPSLAPYLRILCILFPFCSVTSCINGYYYGMSGTKVPAMTQVLEQLARVGSVFLVCTVLPLDAAGCCYAAVWGIVIGEITSCLYNIFQITKTFAQNKKSKPSSNQPFLRSLLWLTLTLTATKLIVSILHSTESVLIPAALKQFGHTSEEALSIYGILTGMSMAFILFPSAITNSFAILLLPNIAGAYASRNEEKIKQAVTLSVKYSLLIGILCTCIFLVFGRDFGLLFFHNEDAGSYLTVLSWLCPFLYIGTTLASVINGMGKTSVTFSYTMVSLGIKILFLLLAVPRFGIRGYLIGLLASQLLLTLLEAGYLRQYIRLDATDWILFPSLFLLAAGSLFHRLFPLIQSQLQSLPLFPSQSRLAGLLALALCCCLLCLCYSSLLYLKGTLSRQDLAR